MKRLLLAFPRSIFMCWLANLVKFNVDAIGYLGSRYRDGKRDYSTECGYIGSQPASEDHNDLGLNFFARVILQYRYDFVIEIGALSLERAKWLAKTFPQTRIHALDITKDFAERDCIDGVHVGPNNLTHIREIALGCRRGIVLSHGTLCCYPQQELSELIATLRDLKLDLAFSEPNTIGEESLTVSLKRTGMSWYHPYLKMLREAGYDLPDNKGKQIRDCVSKYAEERTFVFAQILSSHPTSDRPIPPADPA